MMKKLLSTSLFAAFALFANAYGVGEFAYTKVAKYQIKGENLVVNGKFNQGNTGLDGWTATDATLPLEGTFTMLTGGPNGSNSQQVLAGQTALTNGMYQKIAISAGGTYVVSFKVKGATAGFTDLDMTGGNTNYMNVYYNTDAKDSLATVDGTNLYYGTDGVSGGYGFSFGADGFTEAVFAVDAPANGNIIIDFRGLAEGLEIADVCCHLADAVYDDRIASDRIAYFQKYLNSEGIAERDYYEDFQAMVAEVQDALARNAAPSEMEPLMQSLEGVWSEFVAVNFENIIDLVGGTGNNSANWMNWTSKWNKLSSEYKGTAPWTWSTDRWSHKTAAADAPMAIQWMRGAGANNNWNNIATMTVDLAPGTYYWGVTGQGGMMTLNKNRWARSWANECAETKLFFNGDTILIDTLNAARNKDYVLEFKLEGEGDTKIPLTLGIICNNVSTSENAGFDVQFYSPVLYKLVGEGLTEGQKIYIENVYVQLDALKGRIDVANGYCEAANDTLPWGKEALKAGAEEAQARYDAWAAMDTTAILETMDNDEVLADSIMNNGVRFLNNNYITPFLTMNTPFSDMLPAVEAAEVALGQRIYSSSTKMADLDAEIKKSLAMYDEKLKVAFSSADSLALVEQREAMNAMVEAFKLAIDATVLVDIDFNNGHSAIVEHADPEGLVETYYTYEGAKGTMTLPSVATAIGTTMYEIGYGSANDETTGLAIRTDSLGMLRVGSGEAVVKFEGAPAKATDIVNIKFDIYYGNLNKCHAGYKVLTAEGDTICGLNFSKYSGTETINTFAVNYNSHISGVGSSAASNPAIAAESNKTSFDIVIDYGKGKMYCYTANANKSAYITSEEYDIPAGLVPAQFVLYSDYNNADRRSWFDNLLIQNIAAGEYVDAIEDVQVVKPVANGIMYNLMGQQILKPVKGQIYIMNGVKNIAR